MSVMCLRILGFPLYRRLYLTLLCMGCGILLLYFSYVSTIPPLELHSTTRVPTTENDSTRVKTFLLWTHYYKVAFYGFGEGTTGFDKHECPVKACRVTDDRSELSTADAVVFHGAELRRESPSPKHAHPDQLFVFLVYESPWSIRRKRIENLTDVFNVTVSYMRDADITVPYGAVLVRDEPTEKFLPSKDFLRGKTKHVAWLVSNCHPISARKQYGEELARYVDVDIYGNCGNLSCSKSNVTCYKDIISDYMFVLAFENSYCTDYATEKLFRSLKSDIVPVTLGRANYSDLLPPKSYIDVRDYQSPRHLADYLNYLYHNRTAYGEYFEWKRTQYAVERSYTRPKAFCRLCELLHGPRRPYGPVDPSHYFSRERHCLTGADERYQLHLAPSSETH